MLIIINDGGLKKKTRKHMLSAELKQNEFDLLRKEIQKK